MNEAEAREFTNKMKEEASGQMFEDDRAERISGLGYRL